MRSRIIYDPGEPVPLRDYSAEWLAVLDQTLLAGEEIPTIIQQSRNGETRSNVRLMVRREHLSRALEFLKVAAESAAEEEGDDDTEHPNIKD